MPSKAMITKSATAEQVAALKEAAQKAGITQSQAIEQALKVWVEAQGVQWPTIGKHGGLQPGGFGRKPESGSD